MDPAVAGLEFRALANSSDNWALREAAKEGHADVYKMLMDPEAAGPEYTAIVNLDSTWVLPP